MSYWILKTEPGTYSLENLKKDKTTNWDGVRNYQARNNLKLMKVGDLALIYHSVGPKELVGVAKVVAPAFEDETAQDGDWVAVKVQFVGSLKQPVKLVVIKSDNRLKNLSLVRQGRLSVCPVSEKEWHILMELAGI